MKTSIKINDKYIQKILLGSTPVQRIYQSGSIVYEAGGSTTPCFEVVSTISQASGDYVDVYVKGESKWYKRNNLNQYEEYGIMPIVDNLSNVSYYVGKYVVLSTDNHEYKWNGTQWVDLGVVMKTRDIVWVDSSSNNASFTIGHYWGTNYKMVFYYKQSDSTSEPVMIMESNNKGPIEYGSYFNSYILVRYKPASSSSNTVNNSHQSTQFGGFGTKWNTMLIVSVKPKNVKCSLEDGTYKGSWGTYEEITGWYNGLYEPAIYVHGSNSNVHVRHIEVYDSNENLLHDFVFKKNEGVTGANEIYVYDTVNDVSYQNTNDITPVYHIEHESYIDAIEDYDVKVAPADDVHYNTLAELEFMECPWIGMTATVGQDYTVYVYTENGWVIGDVPLDLPYMRFTALEDTTFTFKKSNLASADLEVKYSIDGKPWKNMEFGVATPTVPAGSYVLFKSNFKGYNSLDVEANGHFSSTGNFNLSGNIMSLIYGDEFVGQTSLANYKCVFGGLFSNCTKLKSISSELLPATTLSISCYYELFLGCTGLTSIPSNLLQATTLADRCYKEMFMNCSGITSVSSGLLPANNMATQCYSSMFYGSGITSIPSGFLPATNLANSCYSNMFAYSNVTSIPADLLPATTLANSCYYGLFSNSKITSVPAGLLPATNLVNYCYQLMFYECKSLKSADIELPATTVNNNGVYSRMFFNCTNLTDSPIIKATSVSGNDAFYEMFYGCGKMKYLVCDIMNEPSSSISSNWLGGVAATGTFYKNPNATWDQTITPGTSTVPSGWIITTLSEPEYLKFTTVDENGSTYAFSKAGLEYSIDGGEWTTLAANTNTPNVPKNSNIRFRGYLTPNGSEGIGTFSSSGKFDAEGDLMTLLYGEYYVGQNGKYANYMFSELFMDSKVVDATNLVIPNAMGDYYYNKMFYSCTSLTSTPSLPFSEVGYYSCRDMFFGCTSLITIQPMTIGSNSTGAMYHMFYNCTSLVDASMITITNEEWDSCDSMFYRCTSLRKSPIIKGDITQNSCNYMFNYCSSLEEVVYLGTTEPKNYYSTSWLNGVSATGTFYMSQDATWDSTVTRDADGIPAGWTIVKVDPNNY